MSSAKKLSELKLNESAVVKSLETAGALRRRFMDMGIIPGARIKALFRSLCGDPTAYLIQGTVIAIRNSDAAGIIIY